MANWSLCDSRVTLWNKGLNIIIVYDKPVGQRGETPERAVRHKVVLVPQQLAERAHTKLERLVARLHLAAQPRHHRHGRVQRVLVNEPPVLENKGQEAVEAARLKHGRRLARTDELQWLDALLCQVYARLVVHLVVQFIDINSLIV